MRITDEDVRRITEKMVNAPPVGIDFGGFTITMFRSVKTSSPLPACSQQPMEQAEDTTSSNPHL